MASNSKIEWTDHTVNFWWGCTKVSPACTHCYAETMAKQRSKMFFGFLVEWGVGKMRGERLEKAAAECWALDTQAMRKGVRYRVFVNSMSDWLDSEVPIEWLAKLLDTIHKCKHLDFQLLTKRPQNWRDRVCEAVGHMDKDVPVMTDELAKQCVIDSKMDGRGKFFETWGKFRRSEAALAMGRWIGGHALPNVWIGTTVESQEWADRRVPELLKIPAVVRFLSCEPMSGAVDLTRVQTTQHWPDKREPSKLNALRGYTYSRREPYTHGGVLVEKGETDYVDLHNAGAVHWVIAGGESGGQARALHPGWVKSLRDQCKAAGVPFFFKQWGEWVPQGEKTAEPMADDELLRGKKHDDGTLMLRVGKKDAGAYLDGKEWRQMPALAAVI
jgi:protein gp37